MLVGLPEGESRASGVLQDGHAAGIENVEGRGQNRAAKLRGAGGGSVSAFDRDIQIPVGRNAARELVRAKGAACGGIASFDLENRIDLVGADGKVLRGPAKDLGIEILGGSLVGGGEFGPAECAGSVFFDVGHSAGTVLPGRDGGKRVRGRGGRRGGGEMAGKRSTLAASAKPSGA